MAYLNCPTCRLTIYTPKLSTISEDCPRCRAKLGKASRLFRSKLPPRLQDKLGESLPTDGREETAPAP
jgi:ssDNA-binding Zn-finger/Zn-ribbon topoisomerase 1